MDKLFNLPDGIRPGSPSDEYILVYDDGTQAGLDWERLGAEQRANMEPDKIEAMENRAASIQNDFRKKHSYSRPTQAGEGVRA